MMKAYILESLKLNHERTIFIIDEKKGKVFDSESTEDKPKYIQGLSMEEREELQN